MSLSEHQLEVLVERSLEMHAARNEHLSSLVPYSDVRFELAFDCGLLSIEHADAAKVLGCNAVSVIATQLVTVTTGMKLNGMMLQSCSHLGHVG